ncbi:MAG TPA: tetratricopeptide repeat protein [Anaerolineae bacterium]|nr:tetratricopeptide repeat protein [Anaerolineae bacterium]
MNQRHELEQTIAALATHRPLLGDEVVDILLASAQRQLAAVTSTSAPQRKQATILFAHLHEPATTANTMSQGKVNLLKNLWGHLDQAILLNQGHIDKHLGNGIMAIWGASARENDPELAIRAALAMKNALDTFNTRYHTAWQLRFGLNTGLVLLGHIGQTEEFTAMGDTVNIASRVQSAAQPGQILITYATYRHVRGLFEMPPLPAIDVKGKSEPIAIYNVTGPKAQAVPIGVRTVQDIETDMIGRAAEFNQLQTLINQMMTDQKQYYVVISGKTGVGKSRLIYELDRWLEAMPQTVRYFKGRARQRQQYHPHALIRNLLAFRFHIHESDPPPIVEQKLRVGLNGLLNHDEVSFDTQIYIISRFLGFDIPLAPPEDGLDDDAEQRRNRALLYLSEFLYNITQQRPTVILLEDLHWADTSSVSVLRDLSQTLLATPMIVIATSRPSFLQNPDGWHNYHPRATLLELHPLTPADSFTLIRHILRKVDHIPDELCQLIADRADGNPFYIEELIKMLIEDGIIITTADHWHIHQEQLSQLRIPETLTGTLQARLDSLPPDIRADLQRAAVVGRVFWADTLAHLGGAPSNSLPLLLDRQLISHQPQSSFKNTEEYLFVHALLRDVTYETILKRERRTYHQHVADWLRTQSGDRAGEYWGMIGEHLANTDDTIAAANYFARAGQRAQAQYAPAEAIAYTSRAINLLGPPSPHHYPLLLTREEAYHTQGQRDQQLEDLHTLTKLIQTDETFTVHHHIEIHLRRARYMRAIDDYPLTIQAAHQTLRLLRQISPPTPQSMAWEAKAHLEWGQALALQANYQIAQDKFDRAFILAHQAQKPALEAESLRHLGFVTHRLGDHQAAKSYYDQALQLAQQHKDLRGEGLTWQQLTDFALAQGNYQNARRHADKAGQIFHRLGDREGESYVLGHLGISLAEQGEYALSREYHLKGLELCRRIGNQRGEALRLNSLGFLAQHLGDYDHAEERYQQSLAIFQRTGDRAGECLILVNLSLLSFRQNNYITARQFAQQVFNLTDSSEYHAYAYHNLGHAYTGLQQWPQAQESFERAIQLRETLGEIHLAMESRAGLAYQTWLAGDPDLAVTILVPVWDYIQENQQMNGAEEPFWVYWVCYQLWQESLPLQAEMVLALAYQQLHIRAKKIGDSTVRTSFLYGEPINRQLIEWWEQDL